MQQMSVTFTFTVIGALGITSGVPGPAIQGQPYSFQCAATGGTAPYTWVVTSGSLPTGLTLSSEGLLSGTPTVGGDFAVTITVSDAG